MFLYDNPVLQRELLQNLRTKRSFLLLLAYQLILGAVVYFAWPQQERLEANAEAARRLVNLVFLGQYVLASLMAPSFAAGSISGEKERKTYELLLATPMWPSSIVMGKLFAALAHLGVLIFASLPIVLLCLPLGGVSLYEVLAAYLGLSLSVMTFGMISVACSSYFRRTSAALVASYLLILPLALVGVLTWNSLAGTGELRLWVSVTVIPVIAVSICAALFHRTTDRMLHPPDVGSEGKEVVDLEQEAEEVVGLVIQPDRFPDRLFAPPKRVDLLPDHANPVYSKEIHSEIFSQGTLMLRLVIQVSMLLAIPIMAFCLFLAPAYAAWYIAYVLVFNLLVGPVFSAGTVTSERERQTLDLLLTTTITPWQILWGKLIAGLRVSTVLTMFLVWPLFLACVIFIFVGLGDNQDNFYWRNITSIGAYMLIILLTCATTAVVALFCSVLYRKTASSLMTTYVVLATVFCVPMAVHSFAKVFYDETPVVTVTHGTGIISPFSAAFAVPLEVKELDWGSLDGKRRRNVSTHYEENAQNKYLLPGWWVFGWYVVFALATILLLMLTIVWLFNTRWRVSQ
jgi:ABC-type transport system involved in multi-copper enzyme maturation permease subunit